MEIKRLMVGKLAANCYLLISGKELAVIDPGGEPDPERKSIRATAKALKYEKSKKISPGRNRSNGFQERRGFVWKEHLL